MNEIPNPDVRVEVVSVTMEGQLVMNITQKLFVAFGANLKVVDAADFDGTNDYLLRGGDLTGNADSKSGILSVWVRTDETTTTDVLLNATTNNVQFGYLGASNDFQVIVRNAANTILLDMRTAGGSYGPGATWYHVLASWNLATSATHLYINDVSDKSLVTGPTDDTIAYATAVTEWSIGANVAGGVLHDGGLAEFYFAPGQYLDFSLVANRRKFISDTHKPLQIGTTGAMPTGTAPLIYLHLDDGEAVANFATNRGTGGNLSITGTLTIDSTSPSD